MPFIVYLLNKQYNIDWKLKEWVYQIYNELINTGIIFLTGMLLTKQG